MLANARAALAVIKGNSEDAAKKCIEQIKKYMQNLEKNPNDQRTKKLPKTFITTKSSVGTTNGGLQFLQAIGYQEKGAFWELGQIEPSLLTQILSLLDS